MLNHLAQGKFLILDGATGTYLQQHGLEPGGCPELLNLSAPELITQMAADYFAAGSDGVLTNSFGGNRFMLSRYGVGDQIEKINRAAAENARAAVPPGKFVCGSIGPTGEFMEPLGPVAKTEMYDVFAEQATGLNAGGIDAIVLETQLGLEEATMAIRACKETTGLPVIASMVFDLGPRGYFTMMGVSPSQAAQELRSAGADVVGSNCGNGIERMVEIATEMAAVDNGLLTIKSNAGIPRPTKDGIIYPESPEYMAEHYTKLAQLPVRVLGGCCGTGPKHIARLRDAVDALPQG